MEQKFLKIAEFLGFPIGRNGRHKTFTFLPFNWLIAFLVVFLSGSLLFDSWVLLGKTEKGAVEYFGKYSHQIGPGGFYLKMPLVSSVKKVETEIRYRMEFGFRTVEDSEPAKYTEVPEEAEMLTKGGQLATVFWIVQYTINDPYNWLYKVDDPKLSLTYLSQGSMRLVIGKTPLDGILTTEKLEIQEQNKKLLQSYCTMIGLDVTINEVKLQDCTLPDPNVKVAYDGVMNAIKAKEQRENEAKGYASKKIPNAQGEASRIVNEAKSYASIQIHAADAEVSRFMGVFKEYQKDPETTKQKLWYEAMQRTMAGSKKTVVQEKSMVNFKNF